jgi:hypothetical protein
MSMGPYAVKAVKLDGLGSRYPTVQELERKTERELQTLRVAGLLPTTNCSVSKKPSGPVNSDLDYSRADEAQLHHNPSGVGGKHPSRSSPVDERISHPLQDDSELARWFDNVVADIDGPEAGQNRKDLRSIDKNYASRRITPTTDEPKTKKTKIKKKKKSIKKKKTTTLFDEDRVLGSDML